MRRPLAVLASFYALAFALAWIGWAPLVAAARGWLPPTGPWLQALLVLPAAAPALAARLVSRGMFDSPRPSLLRRFCARPGHARWLLLAGAMPFALLALTGLVQPFFPTAGAPDLPRGDASAVLGLLALSVLANPWEELGWRGFALPRLRELGGPVPAALATGLLSGLWHLPLWWWPGHPMAAYPWPAWFLGGIGAAFIAAWLFFRSGGSLLVTSLFHVTLNAASLLVGIRSFWAYAAACLPWILALGWDLHRRDGRAEG